MRPSALVRAAFLCGVFAVAWGALAFGAVYPWAHWTLAALCVAAAAVAFAGTAGGAPGLSPALRWALTALGAAIILQLVPLSTDLLQMVSPRTPTALRDFYPVFAITPRAHPLSINPEETCVGLALFAVLAFFLGGMTRVAGTIGARPLALCISLLGVALALFGIIQAPFYAGRIYGFWTPEMPGTPFGPFVNKNHFAGWMLMGMPLALGLVFADLTRRARTMPAAWRDRVLWLSSPEASRFVLSVAGVMVMSLSLVLTMSRSGIAAMAVSLVVFGGFVIAARQSPTRMKVAAGVALGVLAVAVVSWASLDVILARFSELDGRAISVRQGAWADAWRVAAAFPAAGTGLNTYGTSMLLYQQHDLARHYAEAHSDFLQLAAEGGALLIIPALVCAGVFARDVRAAFRRPQGDTVYWIRAGAVTGLVAICLQETVEFSLQMPGNAALFALMCGVALHTAPREADVARRTRRRHTESKVS